MPTTECPEIGVQIFITFPDMKMKLSKRPAKPFFTAALVYKNAQDS